jgi:hypothetical protein
MSADAAKQPKSSVFETLAVSKSRLVATDNTAISFALLWCNSEPIGSLSWSPLRRAYYGRADYFYKFAVACTFDSMVDATIVLTQASNVAPGSSDPTLLRAE